MKKLAIFSETATFIVGMPSASAGRSVPFFARSRSPFPLFSRRRRRLLPHPWEPCSGHNLSTFLCDAVVVSRRFPVMGTGLFPEKPAHFPAFLDDFPRRTASDPPKYPAPPPSPSDARLFCPTPPLPFLGAYFHTMLHSVVPPRSSFRSLHSGETRP